MENEEKQLAEDAVAVAAAAAAVGEIHKQRQTMPDGKRYIIFYTFGTEGAGAENEVQENV
jgi:hypothetical protein